MAEKKAAAKKKAAPRPASERAQEVLDTAQRVVNSTELRLAKAKAAVTEIEQDLNRAKNRLAYAAMNPDLPGHEEEGNPVNPGVPTPADARKAADSQ